MSGAYDDILHLPHHISSKRARMSMQDRAAQFSPFAALTGYNDAIRETARLTQPRPELNEDELRELDIKFRLLSEHLISKPAIQITYFQPDERKTGGRYNSVISCIRKIDLNKRFLHMDTGLVISMDDVCSLDFCGAIREVE